MFVVTGASGHTGSVVARTLLEQGRRVRVILRDEEKAEPWRQWGAEVVLADLRDVAALAMAMVGARGAYLIVPPPVPASTGVMEACWSVVDSMRRAVEESGLPHFVLLSSVGAQHPEGTGFVKTLYLAERELGSLGRPMTILRSAYFMENWGEGLPAVVDSGVMPDFIAPADRKLHMVATRDVGELAARLLREPTLGRRVVELAGPVEYSPLEVADTLARLLGRPIRVEEHTPAAQVPMLMGMGYSAEVAHLLEELDEAIHHGRLTFEHPIHVVRGWTTLDEVLGNLLRAIGALPYMGEGTTVSP
ncbi:NmrA family NAD(P)-binding protein [Archangium lansingense]|uniref:NAD(P)H-binding protein n=1 Tax=Archangium lansingense TaxID=2995310 RepID=A0ABT3ZZ21_9BACT|nr:NmrA family NAD(P)-binding protein [Archangium lansinium]MCY1074654.1 NAD(P)H-binding protein [Archangium lansinium]